MIVGQVVDAATGAPDERGASSGSRCRSFSRADDAERSRDGGRPGPLLLHGSLQASIHAGHERRLFTRDVWPAPGPRPEPAALSWRRRAAHGRHTPGLETRDGRRYVVDEAGEPVVGVSVRALSKTWSPEGRATGAASTPRADRDDRRPGQFRLSQLTPATYVIVAPSTQTTVPAAFLEAPDATIRSELF